MMTMTSPRRTSTLLTRVRNFPLLSGSHTAGALSLSVLGKDIAQLFARDMALMTGLARFPVQFVHLAAFVESAVSPSIGRLVLLAVLDHDAHQAARAFFCAAG